MTDYELLELLAAQAPAPVPTFAEQMLTRARRARRRRQVVSWGPVQLSYDRALVPLSVARSGLQCAAVTYDLSRSGASWVVVGTVGPRAVS